MLSRKKAFDGDMLTDVLAAIVTNELEWKAACRHAADYLVRFETLSPDRRDRSIAPRGRREPADP